MVTISGPPLPLWDGGHSDPSLQEELMHAAWLSLTHLSHGSLVDFCRHLGALFLALLESWVDRHTVLDENGDVIPCLWIMV